MHYGSKSTSRSKMAIFPFFTGRNFSQKLPRVMMCVPMGLRDKVMVKKLIFPSKSKIQLLKLIVILEEERIAY